MLVASLLRGGSRWATTGLMRQVVGRNEATLRLKRDLSISSHLLAKLFSTDHEWIDVDEATGLAKIGISDNAQENLGTLCFVDISAEVGAQLEQGGECGVVESSKAASDIYSPVSGEVVAVNNSVMDDPEIVNRSPYDDGWLIELKIADKNELKELMSESEYEKFLKEQ